MTPHLLLAAFCGAAPVASAAVPAALPALPETPGPCAQEAREARPGGPAGDVAVARLADLYAPASDAVAAWAASGNGVCWAPTAQARGLSLRVIDRLPEPDEPGIADEWGRVRPLVIWSKGASLLVGRWSGLAVRVGWEETGVRAQLLREDRLLYPAERVVVVHVDPDLRTPRLAALLGELADAGYLGVALHVGVSTWTPRASEELDVAAWAETRVAVPATVHASPEGGLDLTWPPAYGVRPLHIEPEEILYFEQSCAGGFCDVVSVSAYGRHLLVRRVEPSADDLTRRWVFARPVVPYVGPSLHWRRPPVLTGSLGALPKIDWARIGADRSGIAKADRRRIGQAIAQREPLIRPCFLGQSALYLALPFLVARPYGEVELRWHVRGDGSVELLEMLSSELRNKVVEACLLRALEGVRLPRPVDGAPYTLDVRYRFGLR